MLESPNEDFSKTTLGAISGTLGKLLYVSGLRQRNGEYFHWGMSRIYGEASANLAIGEAHTDLFLTMLRTPIQELWEEAGELAKEQSIEVNGYLGKLQEKGGALVPMELQGGVVHHFNSVLLALCSLAKARARKTDQAA